MFAIRICGYAELRETLARFEPTHVISAIEQIDKLPCNHLHVSVSDIVAPLVGHVPPTSDHLAQVLDFTAALADDDRLLVHCFAGQSRSTAYAIAVLIQHGVPYSTAFHQVAAQRPFLMPNKRIVGQTDRYFNLDGNYDRLVEDHYRGTLFLEGMR
jgi:predicted protein tyrosine phosphatase